MFPLLLQFEPPALSGIVTALDIVKDIRSRLGSRPLVVSIRRKKFYFGPKIMVLLRATQAEAKRANAKK